MSIVQNVTFNVFQQAFKAFKRDSNFSHLGLQLLFDLLESLSDSTGEDVELDVIGLCCEYSEDTLKAFIGNYADCQDDYNRAEITHIECYLNEYIDSNFSKIMSDQEIRKKYFSFLENDLIQEKDNFIIDLMVSHLIDSMNYREFLNLICNIEDDQDYIESIDNIMYDVVTEYLDNESGLYMISDCRTIVVYQSF